MTLEALLAEFTDAAIDYADGIYFEEDPARYNGTHLDDLKAFIEKAYQAGRESACKDLLNESNRLVEDFNAGDCKDEDLLTKACTFSAAGGWLAQRNLTPTNN